MPIDSNDELVALPVPLRLYPKLVQALAAALAAESGDRHDARPAQTQWTPAEIGRLHRLVRNRTVRELMDMTCASPGERIRFQDVFARVGRTYAEARADLAGLTKLLRANFDRVDWPIAAIQNGGEGLVYVATPIVADAWSAESHV